MIAEPQGGGEKFPNLYRVFGPVTEEIDELKTNGFPVGGQDLNVVVLFVADFKLLYHATGVRGATCENPCPWCDLPKQFMDFSPDDLSLLQLTTDSPEIADMLKATTNENKQRAGTKNIFGLSATRLLGQPISSHHRCICASDS